MRVFLRPPAIRALMVGVTLCAYPHTALGQPPVADPVIGTWKLNAAKSQFSPGPPLKSLTVKFETVGYALKVTSDGVDPDGKALHSEYTASYDGKDYPITGSPTSDTVSLKKIDGRTSQRTDKKGGKVVGSYTRKVSAGGETLTVHQTGTDAKGKPIKNTLVLDKQ